MNSENEKAQDLLRDNSPYSGELFTADVSEC
jgi:hypothetical protein